MCNQTLMDALIDSGYPRNQMFNHESDLYVYASLQTRCIIEKWYEANGLQASVVTGFISQTDGKRMYDCPFQYIPWWEDQAKERDA